MLWLCHRFIQAYLSRNCNHRQYHCFAFLHIFIFNQEQRHITKASLKASKNYWNHVPFIKVFKTNQTFLKSWMSNTNLIPQKFICETHKTTFEKNKLLWQKKIYYASLLDCVSCQRWLVSIWGSVRSGSSLSPEGCNFSRFLKRGFEWLNMFQLFYYDAVREDFTKKSPDHLFQAFYRCPKSPGSVRGYIRASWFWKKS